jgi:GNAT superfamily N-acetyltransferase
MQAMQLDDPWSIPFKADAVACTLELFLRNPSYGQGWFVERDRRIIGYIIMSFDFSLEYGGRNVWVDEFFIERQSRGRGFGAQVLEFFEQAARDAGATAIHLGVSEGNRAIELYRRCGFHDHRPNLMIKLLQ